MRFENFKSYMLKELKDNLSSWLTYHGYHHTIDVLNVCEQYIQHYSIQPVDAELLRVGAIIHDAGFLKTYINHEDMGISMAQEILPKYNYTTNEIEIVSGLIRATKVPQKPLTELEKIICDADLDYLGKDDFEDISASLYTELQHFINLKSRDEWDRIQIKFLNDHSYHTEWAIKNRTPGKIKQLKRLKKLVAMD